jgi:hypothetical protein
MAGGGSGAPQYNSRRESMPPMMMGRGFNADYGEYSQSRQSELVLTIGYSWFQVQLSCRRSHERPWTGTPPLGQRVRRYAIQLGSRPPGLLCVAALRTASK